MSAISFSNRKNINIICSSRKYIQYSIRNKTNTVSAPAGYCVDLVRQLDYENFLCTLLLSPKFRSLAFAVRAFNIEVARIQDQVSQVQIGQMRVNFWLETVERLFKDDVREHPVAIELYRMINETSNYASCLTIEGKKIMPYIHCINPLMNRIPENEENIDDSFSVATNNSCDSLARSDYDIMVDDSKSEHKSNNGNEDNDDDFVTNGYLKNLIMQLNNEILQSREIKYDIKRRVQSVYEKMYEFSETVNKINKNIKIVHRKNKKLSAQNIELKNELMILKRQVNNFSSKKRRKYVCKKCNRIGVIKGKAVENIFEETVHVSSSHFKYNTRFGQFQCNNKTTTKLVQHCRFQKKNNQASISKSYISGQFNGRLKDDLLTIKDRKLSKNHLKNLVIARMNPITSASFKNLEDMEKYAEASVSPVFYIILQGSGLASVHTDHTASHLGKAQGITNIIRSIPISLKSRIVPLPQDLLLKHNISQESILRRKNDEEFKQVIFDVASRAKQHLDKAKSLQKKCPDEASQVFLPAICINSYLTRLQKADFNIFNQHLLRRNNLLHFQLFWNKLLKQY